MSDHLSSNPQSTRWEWFKESVMRLTVDDSYERTIVLHLPTAKKLIDEVEMRLALAEGRVHPLPMAGDSQRRPVGSEFACEKFVREAASDFCAVCGYRSIDHLRKRAAVETEASR